MHIIPNSMLLFLLPRMQGGAESLSTCPRTIEEIEDVMAGGAWPPKADAAPYLKRAWTKLGPNGFGMELLQL